MQKAGAFKAVILVTVLAYAGIMGIAAQQTVPGNDSSSAPPPAIGPFGFHMGGV